MARTNYSITMENERRKLIDRREVPAMNRNSIWPWLIALLILLAIGGYLWARHNKTQNIKNQNIQAVTGNKTVITDFQSIYMTKNISDLQSRPIEINSVLVRKVVIPDKIFLVSDTAKDSLQLYVVVGDNLEPGSKTSLKQGQTVKLKGILHTVPASLDEVVQKFLADKTQAQDFLNHLIYAEATAIN